LNTYTNAYLSCTGVWTNNSDRNQKERFRAIDAQDVLAKVVALPVTEWSYKAQPEVRRIGPVAQDFHAAFGIGQDELTIASTDEAGVAFAAIQGLHALVQQKDARIVALEQRLRSGEEQLALLKGQMKSLIEAINARASAEIAAR
jgi:L-arabinose isomerase